MNLHQLIDQLAAGIPASNKNIRISNEIDPQFQSDTRAEIIRKEIEYILNRAAGHTENCNTRIPAKVFHNITLLQVRSDNSCEEMDIENKLNEVKSLAEQPGGCLYITAGKLNAISISFTFMSLQLSAVA
jgi:hypothetical protein